MIHVKYNSVSELRDDVLDPKWKRAHNATEAARILTESPTSFLGGVTPQEAVEKTRTGDPKGEVKVREFHDLITSHLPRAIGTQRVKHRKDSGDELDIHAVNRGDLSQAWTSSSRAMKRSKNTLQLCIDVCGNGGESADDMQWRGIAGIALSEVMGKAGYAVEIVACIGATHINSDRGSAVTIAITVKPASARADYGLLAATVGTVAFFRTLGIAAIVRACDNDKKQSRRGVGSYADVSKMLPLSDRVTQLFVPATVRNQDSAEVWVKSTIKLLQGV